MKIMLVKVFRDIWRYKARSLLMLLGVLIGLSASGAVLSAYTILNREMDRNFMGTNPASIVMYSGNFDKKAVQTIKNNFPKAEIEMRKTSIARIDNGDGSFGIIYLKAVEDFIKLKVDTFTVEKGILPVLPDELTVEKDSFKILKNVKGNIGEKLSIKMPSGKTSSFTLSGIVHAPGLAPASMEHFSYAFVRLESLQTLGQNGWFDEMRIVSHENRFDRQKMRGLSENMAEVLEQNGYKIIKIDVPVPGRHPHANQLDSILFLLQAFTFITLLAGCLIIINLLNFILSGQSKQIAIMKATGANTLQIAIPYFLYVFVISFLGLLLSFPLSILAGSVYSGFAADILNFKIVSYAIPLPVYIIQIMLGIAIPLLSAAYPIFRNCSISVKDGLANVVLATGKAKKKNLKSGKTMKTTSSLLRIPFTNLGRKKSRTILAILALTMGGVLFLTSRNISASVQNTVDRSFNAQSWDYDIRLAGAYPQKQLNDTLSGIDGLKDFEIWESSLATFNNPEGRNSTIYQVRMMPEGNVMGRLSFDDTQKLKANPNRILINKMLSDEETWMKTGSIVKITAGGKSADFMVAGIVNEVPALAPAIFIDQGTYKKLFGSGMKQSVLASAISRDKSEQIRVLKEIEDSFTKADMEISENWTLFLLRKAFTDHLQVIINLLTMVVLLAVIVGGMSIASATGLSISERKREIAVIRASGAGSSQTLFMILLEALLMGTAGWLMGILVSIPVSRAIGNYFGQIFLQVNLVNIISLDGIILWFLISIFISLLSGLFPALKIAASPLRDMLEYE
jgi:putative ABC transport system permease protein